MEANSASYEDKIKLLVKLSSLINSSLDLQDVLDNALLCVEQFLEAEVSSIFEVDKGKGELFFRLARGTSSEKIKELRLRIGEGVAGWVAQTEKPLICADTLKDQRFCRLFDDRSGFQTRSILCVPLKSKDQLMGVLEVMNKKGGGNFTDNDLEILTILGNQIGIALENAHLYGRLKDKLFLTLEELKIAEKKLIQAERLAALGKLSQGVAHEVRNPIMIIGGFARRVQKQLPPSAPAHDFLKIILAEVERLGQMVREIEAFAKLPEPNIKPANLTELVEQVISENEADLRQQEIQVRRQFPPDLPPIPVDGKLLRQALEHLIANAKEAMPQGGWLAVALALESNQVRISLNDTGSGIAPEDLPYLFDPFFSTKPSAMGMGLTTVHQIVSDHHGEIQINSALGQGTEVNVWLPRWQVS